MALDPLVGRAQELAGLRRRLRSGRAREIRRDAGLSQVDLGRRLGIDGATVSRWESGARLPRGDLAISYGRLLRALERVAA